MIGDLIREERSKQNMSLRELARRANISSSYLSDLENCNFNNPSLKVLVRISNALNTQLVSKDYINYIQNRKELLDLTRKIAEKNLIDVDLGDPFNNIEREAEVYEKVEKAIIRTLKQLK